VLHDTGSVIVKDEAIVLKCAGEAGKAVTRDIDASEKHRHERIAMCYIIIHGSPHGRR